MQKIEEFCEVNDFETKHMFGGSAYFDSGETIDSFTSLD